MINVKNIYHREKQKGGERIHNPQTQRKSQLTFQSIETVIIQGLTSDHSTALKHETICTRSNYWKSKRTHLHHTFVNCVIQQRNLAVHASVPSEGFLGSF